MLTIGMEAGTSAATALQVLQNELIRALTAAILVNSAEWGTQVLQRARQKAARVCEFQIVDNNNLIRLLQLVRAAKQEFVQAAWDGVLQAQTLSEIKLLRCVLDRMSHLIINEAT